MQLLLHSLQEIRNHGADLLLDFGLAGVQTTDDARLDLIPRELVPGELDVAGPLDIPIVVRDREACLPQNEFQLAVLDSRFDEDLERDRTPMADDNAKGRGLRRKPAGLECRLSDPQLQAHP